MLIPSDYGAEATRDQGVPHEPDKQQPYHKAHAGQFVDNYPLLNCTPFPSLSPSFSDPSSPSPPLSLPLKVIVGPVLQSASLHHLLQ